MLPIVGVLAFFLGTAVGSAGSSARPSASGPMATATVTTTTTASPATVTRTQAAQTVTKASTPPAVQAVLKAWTVAGPQPDKQKAAMAQLKRDWPTLAEALEKATGVKAPSAAAAPAQAASATIPGDGTFIVGSDVKAGTFKSSAPSSGNCYWERDRDDKNSVNSIIANNNTSGPSVVTIRPSDKLFQDSGCSTWVRVG